jgi:hypothetical protein
LKKLYTIDELHENLTGTFSGKKYRGIIDIYSLSLPSIRILRACLKTALPLIPYTYGFRHTNKKKSYIPVQHPKKKLSSSANFRLVLLHLSFLVYDYDLTMVRWCLLRKYRGFQLFT